MSNFPVICFGVCFRVVAAAALGPKKAGLAAERVFGVI